MSGAILSIRNLTIALNGDPAGAVVKNLSLDVRAGETMCLVGESGSGKSLTSLSTMGLLPSVLKPIEGSILLNGEDMLGATARRLRQTRATTMSMIFQEPMTALNPVMRVGAQIAEVLDAHASMSAGGRRDKVLAMMEDVHLPDVERIYSAFPHQLSGGQRQRIMIAMALILRPKLLIADEPTTALDVTTQAQILKLIRELRENTGTAVLFITHDMGVVAEIADSVTVLKLGEVMEQQPVADLLRRPITEYTRDLLRAVPSLVPRKARPPVEETGPATLATTALRKVYSQPALFGKGKETVAADAVTLTLRKGRTLGIVGESGSGKSTVARCVVRLIDPTSGSIKISGEEIATVPQASLKPHRKRVQIVFQDPFRSLNPRIEIGESITEGPTNFGVPKAEAMAQARDLLELVGLPASAVNRFPHQFSGGQRQRIAIARALAMKPDLLVADEAVSALDVSVQAQVLDLLDEIQTRMGIAILFITHDLRVAAQICDDVMVMQKGIVVEYGPAAGVLANPSTEYTRSLIEAAPGRHWDFGKFRSVADGLEAAE
jgi:peptide/nickel transport system ATP-binding protein